MKKKEKLSRLFASVVLAAALMLTGVGCNGILLGGLASGEDPAYTGVFNGTIPMAGEGSRFVALEGTALPDLPVDEPLDEPAGEPSGEPADGPSEQDAEEGGTVAPETAPLATEPEYDAGLPLSVPEIAPPPEVFSIAPQSSNGSASSAGSPPEHVEPYIDYSEGITHNTEEYAGLDEHGFFSVATNPLSTFSADVDTASYANLRRMIESGVRLTDVPSGAIRIEEMLNYFHYGFIEPREGEPFGMSAQVANCPWNPDTRLMALGIQAQQPPHREDGTGGSNLVFLVDVSGSMSDQDKLPLLKQSFSILTEQLTEADTVSIVTYAGGVRVVLDGVRGDDSRAILSALNRLNADGSTNGQGGLELAYQLAEQHFVEGGNNRVIMASDGDLNVGISSESDLSDYVSGKRATGVYLSVLGFGAGNFKDNKMEALADNGNGNYHYIDSLDEARKVLVEDLTANLYTVADDVKLQLEFNPAYIKGYRQIGYVNRSLDDADFTDDTKDAAEMGAGHQAIVVYEIVMNDSPLEIGGGSLRYQEEPQGSENGEWLTLALRYKDPGAPVSKGIEYTLGEDSYTAEPDADWVFVSGMVEFGMLVSQSGYAGTATIEEAIARAEQGAAEYSDRQEFVALAKRLAVRR